MKCQISKFTILQITDNAMNDFFRLLQEKADRDSGIAWFIRVIVTVAVVSFIIGKVL